MAPISNGTEAIEMNGTHSTQHRPHKEGREAGEGSRFEHEPELDLQHNEAYNSTVDFHTNNAQDDEDHYYY